MSSSSSSGGHSKLTNFGSGGYFRLDQHQDQLIFCTDAEIQNNPRFQMIQLRRAKVQEFKNYRMIPILDKEVPKGLLEARTKRALAKGKEVMDRGDPLRGRSRLYLEQLRAQVNHRFSLARHRRRHGNYFLMSGPQFYIQLVFKAPLCITLTISYQKIVSGSLFFQLFSTFSTKN